ncbi:hypothetical protein [Actibacterium sp. 188UL27-1]|uniref:hypothetical protein n=1 Tax=Actibacterium sp. 188UL27-1 TaxID=2786961 RepID=UPI00195946F7|nr:hypothetical protein [Actibacterium sp. 188UL27-1]MBM7069794.1 hypothetical protein [Actibacterium sp. 188UL27-1]
MKRITSVLAIAAALSATTAISATEVEEIDVTVDLTALENAEAAGVWTNIASDLENAIAARLVDQLSEDGASITIDIDEVALANSLDKAVGAGEATLQGDVEIRVPGLANNENYTLTVNAEQVQPFVPEGMVVTDLKVEDGAFYDAMIQGFAENVAMKLK